MSLLRIVGALMILLGGVWTLLCGVAFVYAVLWGPSASGPAGGESWAAALVLMVPGLFVLIPGILVVRTGRPSQRADALEHVSEGQQLPSAGLVRLIGGAVTGAVVGYSLALIVTTLMGPILPAAVGVKLARCGFTIAGIVVGIRVVNR